MSVNIPIPLLSAIRSGRCVLFLGAGATRAAGGPVGPELARLLANAFSRTDIPTDDLQAFADVLVGLPDVDREEIDREVTRTLTPIEPSRAHLQLTTFCWPAIFTTNYDRLVERAYDSVFPLLGQRAAQTPTVVLSSKSFPSLSDRSAVSLVKLHGSIGSVERHAPLVLTSDDYRRTEKGRRSMLRLLKSYASAYTILFAGYSFSDQVILRLLESVKAESPYGSRRRMWLATLGLSPSARDYFAGQGIEPLDVDFVAFFDALSEAVEEDARRTCLARRIPVLRDKGGADFNLPARLRVSLDNQIELIRPDVQPLQDARPFLMGARLAPGDLQNHNDVERHQTEALEGVLHSALASDSYLRPVVAVLGSGGSGKSTLAARAAFNIAIRQEAIVCRLKAEELWNNDELVLFAQRVERCVFVVDGLEVHTRYKALRELRSDLSRVRSGAVLLASCQRAVWNEMTRTHPIPEVTAFGVSEHLRPDEAEALIEKLRACSLVDASTRQQVLSLQRRILQDCDSHLVVALLQLITGTDSFRDILSSEYGNLSKRAQQAYQFVALFSQHGRSLPDYVLNEVTVKDWDLFEREIVKQEAELIIVQDTNYGGGRIAFRARHPEIARVIANLTVPKREDRVRMYRAVIAALGGAAEDRTFLLGLLTSYNVQKDIGDPVAVREMFEKALDLFPDDRDFLLQLSKFLLAAGKLSDARDILEYARSRQPRDHFLVHQLGVCLLRQSHEAAAPADALRRLDLFNRAVELFRLKQMLDPTSHYGFSSEAKAHVGAIRRSKRDGSDWHDSASAAADAVERGLASVRFDHRSRLEECRAELDAEIGDANAVVQRILSLEKSAPLRYASSYHLLAECFYSLSHPEEALAALDRGLSAYPGDARLGDMALRLLEGRLHMAAVRARCKRLLSERRAVAGEEREPPQDLFVAGVVAVYENDVAGARRAFRELRLRFRRGGWPVRQFMADEAGRDIERRGAVVEQSSSRGVWLMDLASGERLPLENERAWRGDGSPQSVLFRMGFSFLGTRAQFVRTGA